MTVLRIAGSLLPVFLGFFQFIINSGSHTYSFTSLLVRFCALYLISFFLFSFCSLIFFASFLSEDERAAVDDAHDGSRCTDSRDPLPFPVVEYIQKYGDRLCGCQVSVIRLADDVIEICDDRTRCMPDTAVCTRIKKWRDWAGRVVANSFCHFSQTHSLYIGCCKKIGTKDV